MISNGETSVVFGVTGSLGSAISFELAKMNGIRVIGACRNPDSSQIQFDLASPEIWNCPNRIHYGIIAASFSDRIGCIKNKAISYEINVTNTLRLAKSVSKRGGKVVFLSSNLVFDGLKKNYMPEDDVNPFDLYGQQKADVEQLLIKEIPSVLILRLTKVFHINTHIIQLWKKQSSARTASIVFNNVCVSPISPLFVAKSTAKLINEKIEGIVHITGDKSLSYESIYNNIFGKASCATCEIVEDSTTLEFGTLGVPAGALIQAEDSMQVLNQIRNSFAR